MHRLGTDRNARRVLNEMSDYLSYLRLDEKVYYLNAEGRARVNCNKVRKKSVQVQHYLMRNDLYLKYGQPSTWKNEVKIGFKETGFVIADSFYEKDKSYYLIEIDHTQKMTKNRAKIEKYKKIVEVANFSIQLVWLTTTEYRRKQLQELCEGLDVQILTINDIN
jgi:hypothetical protein